MGANQLLPKRTVKCRRTHSPPHPLPPSSLQASADAAADLRRGPFFRADSTDRQSSSVAALDAVDGALDAADSLPFALPFCPFTRTATVPRTSGAFQATRLRSLWVTTCIFIMELYALPSHSPQIRWSSEASWHDDEDSNKRRITPLRLTS